MLNSKAANRTLWRAGLPVALWNRRLAGSLPIDRLRHRYAKAYWASSGPEARRVRRKAILLAAPHFVRDLVRYSRLNGRVVASRYQRPVWRQIADQLSVYLRFGILPKWYYIFSLYERDAVRSAPTFLNRFETKTGLFRFLNQAGGSTMGNKLAFVAWCEANELAHVPTLASGADGLLVIKDAQLPPVDLFVKPVRGRGGSGAERWEAQSDGGYRGPDGTALSAAELVSRLSEGSARTAILVQPRVTNHRAIADLSNGALLTVRVLSCMDEQMRPEVIAASFRMAVGGNTTVDNIHAGGIASAVDLVSGRLGPASDLGFDAKLGWLTHHPDTKAPIDGRMLPCWNDVMALVMRAHSCCPGFIVVGWDVAITAQGPVLVEGNGGPDVDLIQRPAKRGLADGRFGELLDFHSAGWGATD